MADCGCIVTPGAYWKLIMLVWARVEHWRSRLISAGRVRLIANHSPRIIPSAPRSPKLLSSRKMPRSELFFVEAVSHDCLQSATLQPARLDRGGIT